MASRLACGLLPPAQDALIARRIGAVTLGLHAQRDYLARRGTPTTLAELPWHALIGYDHASAFIRSIKHHLGDLTRKMFALRADSDLAQLAALRGGFGIGMCQAGIAARNRALVPVLPEAFAFERELWLAMDEDLRQSKRCTVLFAALADGLASYISP